MGLAELKNQGLLPFLEVLEENLFPGPLCAVTIPFLWLSEHGLCFLTIISWGSFILPEVNHIPWLVVPYSILKSSNSGFRSSPSHVASLWLSRNKLFTFMFSKDETVKDNLPISRSLFSITSAKSFVPCNIAYSQGIKTWLSTRLITLSQTQTQIYFLF